jgi:hypothetical protein
MTTKNVKIKVGEPLNNFNEVRMDICAITSQEVLERISRHCPEALSIYLHCLNRANENGTVFFSKETVDIDMSEEWHKFRKSIKSLARENLLLWQPIDGGITIQLAEV